MKQIYLNIADYNVKFCCEDESFTLPYNYAPFVVNDATEWVTEVELADEDIDISTARLINEFSDLGYKQEVYECDGGGYVFRVSDYHGFPAAAMRSDADFGHNTIYLAGTTPVTLAFGLNNTLMLAFAFSIAYRGGLMMHSSVIKRGGWAYMFLGKSGTGKSTHSSLWLKHIDGCSLLNDDNPVLRVMDDDEVWVYGSPWSGKTPCYKQDKARVGALVMLEQKPYNKITQESVVQALSSLMCSCSIMIWDKASYAQLMNTMSRVIALVGVHHLECLPDEAAARLSFGCCAKD